jgi:hypothetical protein
VLVPFVALMYAFRLRTLRARIERAVMLAGPAVAAAAAVRKRLGAREATLLTWCVSVSRPSLDR